MLTYFIKNSSIGASISTVDRTAMWRYVTVAGLTSYVITLITKCTLTVCSAGSMRTAHIRAK